MFTRRHPRCTFSAPKAPPRIFCRSARWIPKYGAPNRSTYQPSSATGCAAIRSPVRQSR